MTNRKVADMKILKTFNWYQACICSVCISFK